MNLNVADSCAGADCWLIPFEDGACLKAALPAEIEKVVKGALASGAFDGKERKVLALSALRGSELVWAVLCALPRWTQRSDNRRIFLALADGFRQCRRLGAKKVAFACENAGSMERPEVFAKACETPFLVDYRFEKYRSAPSKNFFESVTMVTSRPESAALAREAAVCAASAVMARNLVNEPACVLDPAGLAEAARKTAQECGLEISVLEKDALEKLHMDAFLAVGRGAHTTPPALIVLRRRVNDGPAIGLIGKAIMYDSGGYSLKTREGMKTMFDDMGGAAAVLGAIRSAALNGLPVNVTAVMAACENKVASDAYVPGDVLGSMSGKTIEMLNTDAEGRLTLADAVTYAIREERVDSLLDIATLTGAARTAVGNRTSAVMASGEGLFEVLREASYDACEKVWQLDCDEELRPILNSSVADIKNSAPGNTTAGVITAGLFIKEFTEGKPWLHVDMAPVNYTAEDQPWCDKGATGYGASLLYHYLKRQSGAASL